MEPGNTHTDRYIDIDNIYAYMYVCIHVCMCVYVCIHVCVGGMKIEIRTLSGRKGSIGREGNGTTDDKGVSTNKILYIYV